MNKLKLMLIFNNDLEKYVNAYYQEELDRIELVRNSIPDPKKLYVIYDMNTGEVEYVKKEKPNKKKIILIKPLKIKIGDK